MFQVVFAGTIICLLAFLRPQWALGFVLTGAIVFYGVLDFFEIPSSGLLTGACYAAAGVGAMLSVIRKSRPSRRRMAACGLFLVFVCLWYLRWIQVPPRPGYYEDFAGRVYVFMAVWAVIPFLSGAHARGDNAVAKVVESAAVFGAAGLVILLGLSISGRQSYGPSWSTQWLPFESLGSIATGFETGLGCLAFLGATNSKNSLAWRIVKVLIVGSAVAMLVRIGQRGPFLFLIPSLLLLMALRPGGGSRFLPIAFFLAVGALVVSLVADRFGAQRAIDIDNYSMESNVNRLVLLESAVPFFYENPMLGAGGGLIGRPVGDGAWQYSNVWLVDSLLETGVFGALAQWGLLALIGRWLFRRARRGLAENAADAAIVPLLVYAFLEAQVSGHVSTSKQLWLLLGLSVSLAVYDRRLVKLSLAGHVRTEPRPDGELAGYTTP